MATSEEVGAYFGLGIVGAILSFIGCFYCCKLTFGVKGEYNAHERVLTYDIELV